MGSCIQNTWNEKWIRNRIHNHRNWKERKLVHYYSIFKGIDGADAMQSNINLKNSSELDSIQPPEDQLSSKEQLESRNPPKHHKTTTMQKVSMQMTPMENDPILSTTTLKKQEISSQGTIRIRNCEDVSTESSPTSKFREIFISYLLSHSISNFTSLAVTQKINHIKNIFQEHPNCKYPSHQERSTLANQIGMSFNEFNALILSARDKERNRGMSANRIETAKRIFIKEWLTMNNYRIPTVEELYKLESETMLSKNTILKCMRSMINRGANVTKESKELVIKWLEENEFRKPTPAERDELLKLTGWNKDQLKHQIQYLREPVGAITTEAKEELRKWWKMHLRMPTQQERDELQAKTNLSRWQLQYQLEALSSPKRRVTREDKEFIRKWLSEHKMVIPNHEERASLLRETSLTPKQLSKLIRQIQDIRGKVTTEAKEYIQQWLIENNMRKPSMQEKLEIQKRTHLGIQQIETQCRRFLERRPGIISAESKQLISEWESKNPEEREPLADLCHNTGLNRIQIHTQLQMIRRKRRQVSASES